MDDLLAEFLTDANESLAELDTALVQLDRVPDHPPTIAVVFRLVHTIKGTCGFFGLSRLERVAHAAENVLGRLRDREMIATPDLITTILAALDRIKEILAGLNADGREPQGDDSALIDRLARAEQGETAAPPVAAPPLPAPPAAPAAASSTAPGGAEAAPGRTRRARAGSAKASAAAEPAPDDAPAEPPVRAPEAAPMAASPPPPLLVHIPAAEAAEPVATGPNTIRVAVEVLENLMTLVSELVLTRNQLLQIARVQGQKERDAAAPFTTPLQRLSQITSDLQEGVMKTRMQPVGSAWSKLPRLVRDLSHELHKKIELVTTGAATELDRQVLEMIRDPLTHMVRNSADHGVETPEVRRAAGKPEIGRITLSAFHEGGHIVIGLADDGHGLDSGRIAQKALARGLATEAELAAMPEAKIHRFIFHPGFSTAEMVTAISGRGVGMDVVLTNIQKIGGSIDLRSRPGLGTSFTIKIPLTLAIVSALIVEASGERFAIPQLTVAELVSAKPAGGARSSEGDAVIENLNGTNVLRLRDRLLPLVRLSTLLRLDDRPPPRRRAGTGEGTGASSLLAGGTAPEGQDTKMPGLPVPGTSSVDIPAAAVLNGRLPGAQHVIVAQGGGAQLGIVVDRVFDTEEIVVKPVTPILRHLTVFGGTTILGDGSVIMILDAGGIARAAGVGGDARIEDRQEAARGQSTGADLSHSEDNTAILLFRAGGALLAVPLGLVSRLEEISQIDIEFADVSDAGAVAVTQYRGQLMPLLPIAESFDRERPVQRVLVFGGSGAGGTRESSMGLVVDEIVDVVDERLQVTLSSARPGLLGTAVISGRAAGVIDTRHWLQRGHHDWFRPRPSTVDSRQPRVLFVEDSDFFRQLLVPTLAAAGFLVTAATAAMQALRLRDSGVMFDAILSDVVMPDMDGLAFARTVRAGGPWAHLPMIALSGVTRAQDVAAAREAGFTEFVGKFDPEPLIATLRRCLALDDSAALPQAA